MPWLARSPGRPPSRGGDRRTRRQRRAQPGALAADLQPSAGLVIITEGLLGYLPTPQVTRLWRRCAQTLSGFDAGRYLSDLHLGGVQTPLVRAFRVLLSAFVRGSVHLHYEDAQAAEDSLRQAGFTRASVRRAADIVTESEHPARATGPGAGLAHIIEASTSP